MNKTKIEWTDYDKGWLAGIIDGEGSLGLMKEKRPRCKANCTYKPRLTIGNTDIKLLIKVRKMIGGALIKHNHRFREDKNQKPFWNLDISANNLRFALPQLKLISKEKQRILLLEALHILKRHVARNNPRNAEEIDRLEKIYQKIRKLNGRVWNKNE